MSSQKPSKKSVKVTPIARATGTLIQQKTLEERKTRAQNVPNNSWDDVTKLSQLCGQLLLQATALRPALNDARLMNQVEDVDALQKTAHVLARDLRMMADELTVLRERHSDRSGNAANPDENMEALDIYAAYVMFTERFEANISPIIMHMVDIIHVAEAKLRDTDNDAADHIGKQVSDELNVITGTPAPEEPRAPQEPTPPLH